jgi:hypothetical protein
VWLDVGHSLLEDFVRVFDLQAVSSDLHTFVDEAFSNLLLTIAHDAVDQALDLNVAVDAVSWDVAN